MLAAIMLQRTCTARNTMTHANRLVPFVVIGLLSVSLTLPLFATSADAQTRALGLLRREPATLFDLGIVYIRQRVDRIANRLAVQADASINAFVNPDLDDDPTIDINITVHQAGKLANTSCIDFRRRIITKFLNLEDGGDMKERAALIMGFAFLHRGAPSDEPTTLGQEMSEIFTVTVIHKGETCTGPLV